MHFPTIKSLDFSPSFKKSCLKYTIQGRFSHSLSQYKLWTKRNHLQRFLNTCAMAKELVSPARESQKCHPAHHADTVCRIIFPSTTFPFKANTFSLFALCRYVTACIFGHYFSSKESWQHRRGGMSIPMPGLAGWPCSSAFTLLK